MLEVRPHVIVDDGCDLVVGIHEKGEEYVKGVLGSCEQTTSGVIRARNMTASGALRFPLVATNENKTKHLLDNYYGTGQSSWDGIMRSTAFSITRVGNRPSKILSAVRSFMPPGYPVCQ